MKSIKFIFAFVSLAALTGCLGPTILANRSMVEFYNATTDGKNYKSADKASSTIDAAKEYDQAASLTAGSGTANSENQPSSQKTGDSVPDDSKSGN